MKHGILGGVGRCITRVQEQIYRWELLHPGAAQRPVSRFADEQCCIHHGFRDGPDWVNGDKEKTAMWTVGQLILDRETATLQMLRVFTIER